MERSKTSTKHLVLWYQRRRRDKEVFVETSIPPQATPEVHLPDDSTRRKALIEKPGGSDTPARVAALERDGKVVSGQQETLPHDPAAIARLFALDLMEDLTIAPRGVDASGRLTAAGEAEEFVLGDLKKAETLYRRAILADASSPQAHESLRRIHRLMGNWRTVAQMFEQEIAQTSDDERRGALTLAFELLVRTRPEAATGIRWADKSVGRGLAPVFTRLQKLLDASQALASRDVERALRVRSELRKGPEPPEGEEPKAPTALETEARQEWTWSEANLRRFLLRDAARAQQLLVSLFEDGRREPELLEALTELLTEHRQWDELRDIYAEVTGANLAEPEHYEALASLLEVRYRDLHGACEILQKGVKAHPEEGTLARRLAEILRVLDLGDQGQALIDALGNLVELTSSHDEKAALLWEMGRVFEEQAGRTSAAIELFHEALAAAPQHGPTLRSLGRIYVRQNNWYGLADLFEKELAAPDPLPDAWRRHFQLAEIYEEHLSNTAAALRHYRAVLEARPNFAPALEGLVRLFEEEGDWDELVRLLLDVTDRVQSGRRQIHLLEEAARRCERRLDNDLLLREILEKLLNLDPESPRAISAMVRLCKRSLDWDRLISLYLREAGFSEDSEVTASLFWKCGRITEEELTDTRRAEEFYRKSLNVVPDFLPALESLGRLLDRERRYDDLMEVSQEELEALQHPTTRARRMEAMSEILERRLNRRSDAIDMVESMLDLCPHELSPIQRLIHLYAAQGKWELVAELLERKANALDKHRKGRNLSAAEAWCSLGQLRERKLSDNAAALEAYSECLERDHDHVHALQGAIRTSASQEMDITPLLEKISDKADNARSQRLARRHMARWAEQRSGNPAAALEIRQQAVAEGEDDREARDMLEAAFAWKRNLPGLAGLWATAGRSFGEGLLGLLGIAAGIDSASLLDTFLDRWGNDLEKHLSEPGAKILWHTALQEASRKGIQAFAAQDALDKTSWANLPQIAQRRAALELMSEEDGLELSKSCLDRASTSNPEAIRLRSWLARGDMKKQVACIRAEIDELLSPELRVRRLLELADLDSSATKEALSRAAKEKTFSCPIQEELYDQLEKNKLLEVLRENLDEHLKEESLSNTRRGHLAFRLGRTLEALKAEAQDIIDAYRVCFEADRNARFEVLRDIARLSLSMENRVDAIHCLSAFMSFSKDQSARMSAGFELAELYLEESTPPPDPETYSHYDGPLPAHDGGPFGRDAINLLTSLCNELRDTEHENLCMSKLAHAHVKVGSPHYATELFQQIISAELQEDQIDDALALAELYATQLQDLQSAEQVLWLVFSTDPMRQGVLEKLLLVSRNNTTLAETCDRLHTEARNAAPEIITTKRRRELLGVVANLMANDLDRFDDAGKIWGEMAESASDPAERRKFRVRQAQAIFRISGREVECHNLMLELQDEDPFDLAPYEGLHVLYSEANLYSRQRVVDQVRFVLQGGDEPATQGRRKTLPGRSFEEKVLVEHLLPEGLRGGVLQVLRALEPLAVKLWGDSLPTIDALGGRRWRSNDLEQVRGFVTSATSAFNIPKFKLYLGDSGPVRPQVVGSSNPSLWFQREMFEGSGAEVARYLAGYAAGLAWSRVASLLVFDGRDLWNLLEAVLIKQTGEGYGGVSDSSYTLYSDKIGGIFNRSLCRDIAEAAVPCLDVLRSAHCEAWPAMIEELAIRAGLVLSGQVSGAAQGLLQVREWKGHLHDDATQGYLKKNPDFSALLRFALHEDYFALRHGCGLDIKPPRLN